MQRLFSDLVNKAAIDRDVVIVGGGPSAEAFQDQWPADRIVIGVNEHGLKLGVKHDYIVALDQIFASKIEPLLKCLQRKPSIISEFGWSDYQLTEFWRANDSGIVAAWCAWMMGARQVILTGMDCYSGSDVYFWDADAKTTGRDMGTHYHALKWKELEVREPCVRLRLLGDVGPLCGRMPGYDEGERFDPRQPDDARKLELQGSWVEFTQSCKVRSTPVKKGEKKWLGVEDANIVIGLKKGQLLVDQ